MQHIYIKEGLVILIFSEVYSKGNEHKSYVCYWSTTVFPLATLWIRLSTEMFCNAFKLHFVGSSLAYSFWIPGCGTVTLYHARQVCVSASSLPSTALQWLHIHCTHVIWPLWLHPVPHAENYLEGEEIRYSWIWQSHCRSLREQPRYYVICALKCRQMAVVTL